MTKYTVVWHLDAENTLAEIWMDAEDGNRVSAAAASIDRELSHDAVSKGRPAGDQMRVLHRPPLEALFEVSELDRMARVLAVRSRDAGSESD